MTWIPIPEIDLIFVPYTEDILTIFQKKYISQEIRYYKAKQRPLPATRIFEVTLI